MSVLPVLPALTRPYYGRANQPFGSNNTSRIIQDAFWVWSTAMNMLGLATGGTESPSHARHPNSIWFCRGSSNSVTGGAVSAAGVVGTNNWNTTFTPAQFPRASQGTAHPWMLLENTALQLECLINFSNSPGSLAMQFTHPGNFTGGSTTNHPVPSEISKCVGLSQVTFEVNNAGQHTLLYDTATLNGTNYFHFVCADSGEFWVGSSRVGLGFLTSFAALWKCVGGEASDTLYNRFVLSSASEASSNPGAMTAGRLGAATSCASTQVTGVAKTAGGLVVPTAGGSPIGGVGVDIRTGKYITMPLSVVEVTPDVLYRGYLPDLYLTGSSPPGASIPVASPQLRTQTGHLIVPCPDTPLLT